MPAPVKVLPQTIVNALLKWRGNVVAAAGEVGMAPNSMYERIDRMGLDLKAIRAQAGQQPVIPITGIKGVTGMPITAQTRPHTQKNALQAGPIFPDAPSGRRLGGMQQATAPAVTGSEAVPIKTAPRRHQPIRVKPDQRDLLQRAAWELQARFQAATDENLILEQFIEERFPEWLASKMETAEAGAKPERKKR